MHGTVPLELGQLLHGPDDALREAAWEKLIASHTRLLLAVARSYGGGHDQTMERYSFILETLRETDFRRLRGFRDGAGATFPTWLTVTARRLCLDHHRARYGRHRETRRPAETVTLRGIRRALEDSSGSSVDTDLVPDSAMAADLRAQLSERDAQLKAELARLTPREKLLIALRFEDDLTASRIASVLGVRSQFQVYRQLQSILGKLRRSLELRGIDSVEG